MKVQWIRKRGAGALLVLFDGWGMDFQRLPEWSEKLSGIDFLAVSDYTSSAFPEISDAAGYRSCTVLAWSLGVWSFAASRLSDRLPPGPRIALNGTLTPISEQTGIPEAVFRGTGENWLEERARKKFLLRMTGSDKAVSGRSPEDQKTELEALAERIGGLPVPSNPYGIAFCGRRDRIFPFPAQKRFWETRPETELRERDWLHDPSGAPDFFEEVRRNAVL